MKNYIKNYVITVPFILGMILAPMFANALEATHHAGGTRIAVLDLQKIFEESKATKGMKEQMNKKLEGLQGEATTKEKELKKKFQDLESNKQKLSKEAFETEVSKLSKEAEEFQRKSYEQRMQIDKAYAEATTQLEGVLSKIVEKKAKQDNYNIVMLKMTTIFSDPALDITLGVIKDLDQELPKVSIKFTK